ncbi:TPA: serine/threonine protein kinase [Candidatus Poribacteria bacterium]|nr:serine/threonine protein kinase [Candidatus Poribacteria bacterium]
MNTMNQTEINDKTKDIELTKAWYQAAVRTAIVAGVFSLIVCGLLLTNYFQGRVSDPLNSKELSELKEALLQEPRNDSIKEQIRVLDLELRQEYFRQREFSKWGSYLLLAGIVVFLIGIKFAADYRKKLPIPQAKDEQGHEAHAATMARWSIAALSLVLGSAALVLAIISEVGPTGKFLKFAEKVTALTLEGRDSTVVPVTAEADYPSQEEINKNWPRFRGPGGLGISAYTNVPSSWNGETGAGILWKTPVPLPGENSPVVWKNRVFLTGATEREREVYCFDADSGELLWQRAVENIPSGPLEAPEVMEDTGFAAPTAVTDGRRVYVIFANGDLVCFDFDGNRIWAKNLGLPENVYGHASSLAMFTSFTDDFVLRYRNLLLVLFDQGGAEDDLSKLLALDALSGKIVWQTLRSVPNSWASPIVINTGTRAEIITCANPWVIAYEPTTGKELWRAKCLSGDVAPSPVYSNGMVFATNEYAYLAAIRPDGEGDVTETHIAWRAEDGLPDICSPLSNGEFVFLLASYGILTCYNAQDGSVVWEQDLEASFKSSPSLVGDKVYLMSDEGVMFIVAAEREFKELSRAELGEGVHTSPAFMDGRIYIRGKKNLYCIGNK